MPRYLKPGYVCTERAADLGWYLISLIPPPKEDHVSKLSDPHDPSYLLILHTPYYVPWDFID
jgi:hypothetical protein